MPYGDNSHHNPQPGCRKVKKRRKKVTEVTTMTELQLEILETLKKLEAEQTRIANAISSKDAEAADRLVYLSTQGLNFRSPYIGSELSLATAL